jgi:hypothetical protein
MTECPDGITCGQTLLIDGEKLRGGKIPAVKTQLNKELAFRGRGGMRKVKFCPDHQLSHGPIIQAADMITGALNDAWALDGPFLSYVKQKIVLV